MFQFRDKAIMVVSSDPCLRAEVVRCLRRVGLHTVEVPAGDDVASRLTQIRFDAVVLEIDPHRDHYEEFVLSVRRTDPQCKIIAVSDPLGAPIKRDLRVLGVRQVVQKPVDVFRLYRALLAELDGHDAAPGGTQGSTRQGVEASEDAR